MSDVCKRLWTEHIIQPLAQVDAANRAFLASEKARGPDAKVIVVLISAALALTIQYYFGSPPMVDRLVRLLTWLGLDESIAAVSATLAEPSDYQLVSLAYWASCCFVCYFALPALVVRAVFRESLSDYGVKAHGAFRDAWIYATMLAVMVPILWLVSRRASFQATYPFYQPLLVEPLWPKFWIWEALYCVQFFALEFFFRGFMIHGLKHRFGAYAIVVMVVPYCMIHFQKPLLEALASIVAGVVLGFMSLKTRSIWLGALVHVAVALTIDLSVLWRRGFFG